ncbi:pilus assembly protein CpaE [Budvicia diplopodorum]|uniref:pilus assembly protein CpaE n=1 Tax=Budvicia diplopodorum TaxID=1119056 RepID=UPI00135BD947|nr:pilus assembly protein CpaE [Budvicia diplopodorum]
MLLFLQKDEVRKNKNQGDKSTLVISSRDALREDICQRIRIAGISTVEEMSVDFFNADKIVLPDSLRRVVIDIVNCNDISRLISMINSQIPRGCGCAVVGDIDSITVAQNFMDHGISYFYSTFQLDELAEGVVNGLVREERRRAINISILGCKGGIGTTLLSYQLSRSVVGIKPLPLLLMQGGHGSHDLDLLLGKKLNQDLVSYNNHIDLKQDFSHEMPDLSQPEFAKYNFIVYDQSIHSFKKEQLNALAESTQCAILMIDHSTSSVRTARQFLDEFDRSQRSNKRLSSRLYICLNESRPAMESRISLIDLESLLGRPVDIVLPYMKKIGAKAIAPGFWKKGLRNPLDQLARYILGIEETKSNKPNTSMLLQLRQRWSK